MKPVLRGSILDDKHASKPESPHPKWQAGEQTCTDMVSGLDGEPAAAKPHRTKSISSRFTATRGPQPPTNAHTLSDACEAEESASQSLKPELNACSLQSF